MAPKDRGEWVRQFGPVIQAAEAFPGIPWRREWRQRAEANANRFAVIRWLRFFLWYCLKRIDGQTRKFENNFDDAQYGLLASYTGHLGTDDHGLRDAAQAIFPGLRVVGLANLENDEVAA